MEKYFYNSLVEGDFGNGWPLRQSLVEGDFWTRLGGCYLVYRGEGRVGQVNYTSIIAAPTDKGAVNLPDDISHAAGRNYFYAVRRVSGTGRGELGSRSMVRLSLDEQGKRMEPRPNAVSDLSGRAISDGRVELSWYYGPMGQEIEPIGFEVFGDGGSGVIDYENALGQVSFRGGGYYAFVSSAGEDGQRLRFVVRSVGGNGEDDGNFAVVSAVVDLSGPDGVEGVSGRVIY
ncbi:MAG: hypothetical protein JXD22_13250 [Sedimentisphaerales bacterium]|nr:hypothetical protein [Sedimentisphaerales bacterium]